MSVQLLSFDLKERFREDQEARFSQDRIAVAVPPWQGDRSRRRWSFLDEIAYYDDSFRLTLAAILILFFLCAGR